MVAVETVIDVSRPADSSISHRVVYGDPEATAQAAQTARSSSSYKRNISPEILNIQGNHDSRKYSEKQRRKRQAIHISLKELLASMELGEHGGVARTVGEKWSDEVKRCGGITRKHLRYRVP